VPAAQQVYAAGIFLSEHRMVPHVLQLPNSFAHHGTVGALMATILIVDDEKPICTLLAHILGAEGYTVHTAASGTEAIAMFRELKGAIDLLISDVSMPDMDGPAVVEELLREAPGLRILFLSGCDEEEERLRSRGFEFLCKPFPLATLHEKVRALLAHHESLV
jgi:two-component system cell cycle sensor histidine kinase/response regulator CckA